MDMMRDFESAHNNATKLEQAMNRERVNMMNGLKNRSECDWYTIKIKYAGLSAERKKEDDKILAILGELDDKYADITENSNVSVSSASEEQEMNSLYNESIPISEDEFIQRSASRISVKVEPEPEPEPEPQVMSVPVPVLPKVQPKKINTMATTIRPKKKANTAKSDKKEVVSANTMIRPKRKRPTSDKKVVVCVKYNTGYKYGGKGFDVFTGFKNQSKPIYAATTLYCRETKNQNKKLLEQYLVNHGSFGGKASTIESISFGNSWNGPVAYVRVRGALKTIKNKMKQLNKKKGAVLSIYERRQNQNAESRENNVLFVNNFDITDKTVHRRFTNLFLQFGQLVKDIKMGIDKHADPFAIVHFAHLDAARECYNTTVDSADGIRFGGKKLSVKYSTM